MTSGGSNLSLVNGVSMEWGHESIDPKKSGTEASDCVSKNKFNWKLLLVRQVTIHITTSFIKYYYFISAVFHACKVVS